MGKQKGILMHISSLCGKYGIGTFGEKAYEFVDFLVATKQDYWQVLPLTEVAFGNSPYQSPSAYAGNTLFIDFDQLKKQRLITNKDLATVKKPTNKKITDYDIARSNSHIILKAAYSRFNKEEKAYKVFCDVNSFWLNDYALFMSIKEIHNGQSLKEFSDGYKFKDSDTINKHIQQNQDKISYYKVIQFLFFEQWQKLKDYANKNGIKIIGDIPIYVAYDSSDLWSNPEIFKLDEKLNCTKVAGVPPDDFCVNGQLWGNPVYDWQRLKQDNFKWWIQRLIFNLKLYDGVRIDHFRGFESYYEIDAESDNAKYGVWQKAPGKELFDVFKKQVKNPFVIAEDLGFITPEVVELVENTGFPNMKVLQFGLNGDIKSVHYPKNYSQNSVAYLGTHDNNTTKGWLKTVSKYERGFIQKALYNVKGQSLVYKLIKLLFNSQSQIIIISMQDYLQLPESARMNIPSTLENNWQWRISQKYKTDKLIQRILDI